MPEKKNTKIADHSINFLQVEYERLAEFQKSSSDMYHRRFDIYLAVFSAAVVGYLSITGPSTSTNSEIMSYIILASLSIVGVTIFASMASLSTFQVHLERAMRMIQSRFTEDDPDLKSYLYFNNKKIGITGTGFVALLSRGLLSGGPKTILVLGNSISISIILIKLLILTHLIQSSLSVWGFVIGAITFLLSGLLHVFYAKIMYKISGI